MHHGIKGMRWGVRRYRNKDGSLTNAGKKHVQNYKTGLSLDRKVDQEARKLINSDSRLKKDFGNDTDDPTYLEYVASGYKICTKSLRSAMVESSDFYSKNSKSIKEGQKIVKKLLKEDAPYVYGYPEINSTGSINEYYERVLYHYGVKGMKWGVRRSEVYNYKYRNKKNKRDTISADKMDKVKKSLTGKERKQLDAYMKSLDYFDKAYEESVTAVKSNRALQSALNKFVRRSGHGKPDLDYILHPRVVSDIGSEAGIDVSSVEKAWVTASNFYTKNSEAVHAGEQVYFDKFFNKKYSYPNSFPI